MNDESNLLADAGWPTWLVAIVVVLGISVVIVVLGIGIGIEGGPGGDEQPGATLVSFETTNARCGTHLHQHETNARQVEDGVLYLSLNASIPVAAKDSTVTARVDAVGGNDSKRYILDLQRSPGNRSSDCYLEARYNATVAIPKPRDYTLIVTHNGHLREVLYIEGSDGGSTSLGSVARPPSMNDSEWQRALNASEEFQQTREEAW